MASLPNGSHSHNDDEDHGAFDIDEDDVEEIIELPDNEDVPMDSGSEAGDDDAIMEEDEDEDGEEGTTIGEPAGPDTSTAHFASHHPHAVFAIAAHPVDGNLIVSGGADDIAYLWRADTGEELARLTGHTDSVSSVGWSCDGELVATGGMDGRVRVWRRVRPAAGAPPGGEWSRWEFLTSIEDGPDEVTVRLSPLSIRLVAS